MIVTYITSYCVRIELAVITAKKTHATTALKNFSFTSGVAFEGTKSSCNIKLSNEDGKQQL
jgi:hypothetical protein